MAKLVALTGGIGSGKSIIAKILLSLGYYVFDCDREAKRIMDSSEKILSRIADEIDAVVVKDGVINRPILSEIVFADKSKLEKLNSIVHGAVKDEIEAWSKKNSEKNLLFVETAILYSSGLNEIVDAELRVEAPEEVRVERVIARNGFSAGHIKKRIAAQKCELEHEKSLQELYIINNDDKKAVLPQLIGVLRELNCI